jgi:hypothetical protein
MVAEARMDGPNFSATFKLPVFAGDDAVAGGGGWTGPDGRLAGFRAQSITRRARSGAILKICSHDRTETFNTQHSIPKGPESAHSFDVGR